MIEYDESEPRKHMTTFSGVPFGGIWRRATLVISPLYERGAGLGLGLLLVDIPHGVVQAIHILCNHQRHCVDI